MSTSYQSRVLQMLCQPLQGMFSTGTALVTSISAPVTLAPGDVLVPIVNDCEAEEAAVKIEPNPDTADRTWPITTTGTAVTITSIQGGAHVNLVAGTALRFDEPPAGIVELASVATSMTGGTKLASFGALMQVKAAKDLGSQVDARSFFACQLGDYPAAVLMWRATTPGDGSVSPSLGADATRVGKGKRIYAHEWELTVVSSRHDSSDRRKREGDIIRDNLLEIITDREAYRHVNLSTPMGIKVTDARLVAATETAYVDVIRFVSWFILKRRDERTFNDWLTAKLDVTRQTSVGGLAVNKLTVEDNRINMSDGD